MVKYHIFITPYITSYRTQYDTNTLCILLYMYVQHHIYRLYYLIYNNKKK